jgi:hypothetical protein
MSISLYDLTVASYLQIGDALAGVLDKAADHFVAQGVDLEEIVSARLVEDMAPFRFQVFSAAHHSAAAARALSSGEFRPPKGYESLSYADLQATLRAALDELRAMDRGLVDSCAGGEVTFRLGEMAIPFTTENFALCFSLPNFYFHAATAYDILRARGMPLGKRDFLGSMRTGT